MLLTQPKTKTDLHRWKPNWATKFAQNWQTRKILPSSNQQSKELFNWMMLREKLHKVSHVGSLERTRALLQMNGKELRTEDLTHISKFVREVLLRKNIPSGRAAETSTRGSSPQHTRNSLAKHTCPLPNYSHEKGPAKVNYANISRVSSWKKLWEESFEMAWKKQKKAYREMIISSSNENYDEQVDGAFFRGHDANYSFSVSSGGME